MAGEKFTCSACGAEIAVETDVIECVHCKRVHCDQCTNDEGVCVPCQD